MKLKIKILIFTCLSMSLILTTACSTVETNDYEDNTAGLEQAHTEANQAALNLIQPAPNVTWSLERDNLIKRFKLQNDRSVMMYMYIFIEGVGTPIGYYLVNKVSSVNSQLTNTDQIVALDHNNHNDIGIYDELHHLIISSPAEDGSYGTNGDAIFGFTPDGLYLEHNMKYISSTAPLAFKDVPMIGKISVEVSNKLLKKLEEIEKSIN